MSLSDCPECWNTPCTCGCQWKGASKRYLLGLIGGLFLEFLHSGWWHARTMRRLKQESHYEFRGLPRRPVEPVCEDLVPGEDAALDARLLERWGVLIDQAGLPELSEAERLSLAYEHENRARRRGVFLAGLPSMKVRITEEGEDEAERAAAGAEEGPAVQV